MSRARFKLVLCIALGAGVLAVALAPFLFPGPTYNQQYQQCVAHCAEIGRAGRLVSDNPPSSTKPSAQAFACACGS